MKEEIIKALTIIEEEEYRTQRDIEIIHKAKEEIERLNNIIKAVRERVLNEGKPLPSPRELLEILDKVDLLNILEGESNEEK